MTEVQIDRTRFARAAELIRQKGFWGDKGEMGTRTCAGLALLDAKYETTALPNLERDDPFYDEIRHLARQLGYEGWDFLSSVFGWNDRTTEAEVLDVLDKLARGESL